MSMEHKYHASGRLEWFSIVHQVPALVQQDIFQILLSSRVTQKLHSKIYANWLYFYFLFPMSHHSSDEDILINY